MKKLYKLNNEETKVVKSIKTLLRSNSKLKPLIKVMIAAAEESIESHSILLDNYTLEFVNNISNNADIKTLYSYTVTPLIDPQTKEELHGNCGRVENIKKNRVFFIENKDTQKQCLSCVRFMGLKSENFNKIKKNGLGACPGVYGKGNELDTYKKQLEKDPKVEWKNTI